MLRVLERLVGSSQDTVVAEADAPPDAWVVDLVARWLAAYRDRLFIPFWPYGPIDEDSVPVDYVGDLCRSIVDEMRQETHDDGYAYARMDGQTLNVQPLGEEDVLGAFAGFRSVPFPCRGRRQECEGALAAYEAGSASFPHRVMAWLGRTRRDPRYILLYAPDDGPYVCETCSFLEVMVFFIIVDEGLSARLMGEFVRALGATADWYPALTRGFGVANRYLIAKRPGCTLNAQWPGGDWAGLVREFDPEARLTAASADEVRSVDAARRRAAAGLSSLEGVFRGEATVRDGSCWRCANGDLLWALGHGDGTADVGRVVRV